MVAPHASLPCLLSALEARVGLTSSACCQQQSAAKYQRGLDSREEPGSSQPHPPSLRPGHVSSRSFPSLSSHWSCAALSIRFDTRTNCVLTYGFNPTHLDQEKTPQVRCGRIVHVRTRRHLAFPGKLPESKVIQLSLERSELGMAKVLVQDFARQSVRIVNFDSACTVPFAMRHLKSCVGNHTHE